MLKMCACFLAVILCSNSRSTERFTELYPREGVFQIGIVNTSNCVCAIDETQIKKPTVRYAEKLDPNRQGFNIRPNYFAQFTVDFCHKYYGPEFLYVKKDEEVIGTFKFMLKEGSGGCMCLAIDGDELKSFITIEDLGIVICYAYLGWNENVIQILNLDSRYRYTNRRERVVYIGCDGVEYPIEEPEDGDPRPLYKKPRECMSYLLEGMLDEADGDEARPVRVRHGRIEKPHGCCSVM